MGDKQDKIMKNEKTIEQLRAELDKVNSQRSKLNNQIEDIEKKELLPQHIEMYEGKFFKYRNSFSCPEKPSDYWWVYIFVEKINYQRWYRGFTATGFMFSVDKEGKVQFEQKDLEYLLPDATEIKRAEFDKALLKAHDKIKTIINHA